MSAFDRQGVRVSSTLLKQHLDLARVRVAEGGLWLDEVLVLARADVASVTFEFDERTRVHIRNREGNSVSCAFTSLDDARELVKAFGRAPDRTMIEIPLVPSLLSAGFGSPVWWRSYLIAGGAVAAWLVALLLVLGRAGFMNPFLRGAGASSLPGWGFAIVVAAALAAIALVTRAPRARDAGYPGDALSQTMELGADGVRIRGALANDFAPYEAIRAVTSRDDTLVLTLQDGHEATTALKVPSRMPEIVARIQGALDAKGEPIDEDVVALLRVPGTKRARLAALRELAAEEGATYREARIPREHLWALVEAPQVDGATRSRAAIALSASLADDDRERLRVAANATASPRVRIALDAIQQGDDDRLADRLDDLDADEEPQALRKAPS